MKQPLTKIMILLCFILMIIFVYFAHVRHSNLVKYDAGYNKRMHINNDNHGS